MIALLLAVCGVAAPPEGRITVWVWDKVEYFVPDRTDVRKVESREYKVLVARRRRHERERDPQAARQAGPGVHPMALTAAA
jgi:hypothetical protein